jgi:protein SCO1/2
LLESALFEEVQSELGDREKYFQPVDKEAPEFTLEDAKGRAVKLQDLRGKVVVLHFIYTSCPDVCPCTPSASARSRRW